MDGIGTEEAKTPAVFGLAIETLCNTWDPREFAGRARARGLFPHAGVWSRSTGGWQADGDAGEAPGACAPVMAEALRRGTPLQESIDGGTWLVVPLSNDGDGGQVLAVGGPGVDGATLRFLQECCTSGRERHATAQDALTMRSLLDHAPVNVILADPDCVIRYMNASSRRTLAKLQHLLPVAVEDILGQSIDIFHKDPAHQRGIVSSPERLPHRAQIQLADEILDLNVSAVLGADGAFLGPVVTWEVITEKVRVETEVTTSAETLASSSEELTAISNQLREHAESSSTRCGSMLQSTKALEQNVESVAAGAEEMGASIQEIANSASTATGVAENAVQVAEQARELIDRLGVSSTEIGDVVKVITSIAQQTNLLALNATIEAARAGEAGRGFAVVANEVKELARETARATEDISQRIEAIQSDTQGAVESINQVGGVIRQISDLQGAIASAVEEQSATTNEIGRSIAEAAGASSGIAEEMGSVLESSQQVLEGTGDALASAQCLAQLASDLTALVQHD